MTVRYSSRSLRDLERIRKYIEREAGDAEVANRFSTQLLKASAALADSPGRYPPYRYAFDWRVMPFGNYLIFFRVFGDDVLIGQFRHAARKPFAR